MVIGTILIGHQRIIPQILNNVCANATVTAAILPVINAANIAVIVVPTLEQIFPYTLGSNIGTTITAILAA